MRDRHGLDPRPGRGIPRAAGVGRVSRERRPRAELGAVVDVEQPVGREVRVESQAKQAPLVERLEQCHHAIAQIEKRRLEALASGGDDVDLAGLLADEAATAAIIRRHQEDGGVEAFGEQLDRDLGQRRTGSCGARMTCHAKDQDGRDQDSSHRSPRSRCHAVYLGCRRPSGAATASLPQ